jgi:uncharacterized coiled-coil DUF342 family protein
MQNYKQEIQNYKQEIQNYKQEIKEPARAAEGVKDLTEKHSSADFKKALKDKMQGARR